MKPTISDTPYGQAIDVRKAAINAASFLVTNASVVLDSDELEAIRTLRIHTRSPFTDMFNRIVSTGKLKQFTVIDLSSVKESIPELFSYADLIIDGKYISKSIPKEYQNAWLNITPLLGKRDAYNSGFVFTDIPALAALFGKGILCMSYNDTKEEGWLGPTMGAFVVEAYAKLLTTHLRSFFNLAYDEEKLVSTIIAAYYAQLMSSDDAPKDIPPLLYRCKDLGNIIEINERMKIFEEGRLALGTQDLNLNTVCQLLAKYGPIRMKSLSSGILYQAMSRGSTDSQAMLLAMDYPPYLIYQLLNNVVGSKNPSLVNLIKYTNMKKKILQFSDELVSSKLFIDRMNR